jgi:beta-keto acid cleavage enzyme
LAVTLFSALAAGRHQMPMVTLSAVLGGSVRVGLEDSLYADRGRLAKSNAEQVEKIRRILAELSIEIATPNDARSLMSTKSAKYKVNDILGYDNTVLRQAWLEHRRAPALRAKPLTAAD